MKTGINMIRKGLAIMLVSGSLVLPHTASAVDLSISDVPLFLSVTAEPNIMFILDDSGSMHWEIMPDENRRGVEFTYPTMVSANAANDPHVGITLPSTQIYSGSDYDFDTASFEDGEPMTSWARSIRNNTIYYNPAQRYDPWAKGDGTSFPAASPTCAPHNPVRTSRGCRNLTIENEQEADWYFDNNNFNDNEDRKFWPALYYNWTNDDGDNDPWNPDNYDRVEIKPGEDYDDDDGFVDRSGRTDCATPGDCTYAEEIQNFANWYTYYRSRVLLARAGVGNAFDRQGAFLRAGFGAINKGSTSVDGTNIHTIISGVRKFEGADRQAFFDDLYGHLIPTSGTPLRTALQDAGTYFSRSADSESSPWDATPGDSSDTTDELSCRQAYTILMSDGYWNGANPGVGNVDGGQNSSTVPEAYEANNAANRWVYPYRDTHSNTLADVAMRYWYTDLRTDLADKVPVTAGTDEAYWQHMVTFTVGLGVTGTLNPDTDLPALTGDPDATPAVAPTLFWPAPGTTQTLRNIDDMWHAAVNSRGDFFSAADPDEFADALSDTLIDIAGRTSSASAVAANSTRISSETLIYQARFNSGDWSGQLLAFPINADGSIGSIEWDASTKMPAESVRKIYSHDGTNGVVFEFANLSLAQQVALSKDYDDNIDFLGSQRVDYLRGDQTNDGTLFRDRSGKILGDVINSDPFFVQDANFGYQSLSGNSGNEGYDYVKFRSATNYLARKPMLYVGANDGMLHAFNADSNLDTSVTPNTGDADAGKEQFAYIPAAVIPKLKNLTSSLYQHEFFVDASARANDAYLPDAGSCPLGVSYTGAGYCWKTVLLGATGAGAKAVFALDVTDPAAFDASKVMWEFTHPELGYTLGQPTIVRLDKTTVNGDPGWYAIFGNGYNSTSQKAQLFIVELANPANYTVIDTGVGSVVTGDQNGLATPIPVDVNGDRITDAIYAGDLQGNIWKFDVDTTDGTNTWRIPFDTNGDGTGTAKPLFQACTASTCAAGERQPITTRPNVGRHPNGGVMVYVGTGRYFVDGDNIVSATPQKQSFYGVRDIGNSGSDYVSNSRDGLTAQTIQYEVTSGTVDYRINSTNTVDYSTKRGWYLDLESPTNGLEGERVISPALLRFDRVIFTTAIPSSDACDFGGSGWLMELDAISGSNLSYAVIDINGDGVITDADIINAGGADRFVSGKKLDGLGDPGAIITAGDTEYKYISTSTGQINVTTEQSGGAALGRQSWRQLR
jgi:type IV pilus assembly protein PilY1